MTQELLEENDQIISLGQLEQSLSVRDEAGSYSLANINSILSSIETASTKLETVEQALGETSLDEIVNTANHHGETFQDIYDSITYEKEEDLFA